MPVLASMGCLLAYDDEGDRTGGSCEGYPFEVSASFASSTHTIYIHSVEKRENWIGPPGINVSCCWRVMDGPQRHKHRS